MTASDRTLTTSLPLRRGSEGFNTSQDYLVKGLIPAGALCSIYGPGGSFKS
ncbi:AAA family ATPase, partial [Klebsiella pneumoniae]|nr:AAA family ATPase [Klebsiella pneumoniae]